MSSEQFSVSWDNFHKNMNSGLNSLLENEDFIDVTLAIEGRYLKAHKVVLSVCSPYFKELFKTSPCKHPIVFMKDVSYTAMSDLLEFMYKGEVQVNEENFSTFIKTAESLEIKGLSDTGNDSAECGTTESVQKSQELKESEVGKSKNSTPQKTHQLSPIPAPKRLRLDEHVAPIHDAIVKAEGTMTEESTATSYDSDLILLKTEPYDEEESSFGIADDDSNENFFDDPLDETNSIKNDNDWMIEDDEEDPRSTFSRGEASTSVTTEEMSLLKTKENSSGNNDSVEVFEKSLKSMDRYEKTYRVFKTWLKERDISEENLLAFFLQRNEKLKSPNSLWAEYSMLKATISLHDLIDISQFTKLITYLKRRNIGHRPNKHVGVFTREQVSKFLLEAPDEKFLVHKVGLIIGVAGACRRKELYNITIGDIEDHGEVILVKIPNTLRSVTITNAKSDRIDYLGILRKYLKLRPSDVKNPHLFLHTRDGKCTNQIIGTNQISNWPSKIATYLKLQNPATYNAHSFKRTSVALLGNKTNKNMNIFC